MHDHLPVDLTEAGVTLHASLPYPLGATLKEDGVVNFAIFSQHAHAVDLHLFNDEDQDVGRVRLPRNEHHVWHVALKGLKAGQRYGYRVHGPKDLSTGHKFDPNKLLVDPYAKALTRPVTFHPSFSGTIEVDGAPIQNPQDSGPHTPKSVVVDDKEFDWEDDTPPGIPMADTVLYEMHVRGFTKQMESVTKTYRGTYQGLASTPSIDYLKKLGITSVQLLPVHQHLNDGFLVDKDLTNYWGYNTLAFFAPEPAYASDHSNVVSEFKEMVKSLHAAGIEVILDVVYNHTCEGNHQGPVVSFKGIDNQVYYRQAPEPYYYNDHTGCGASVDVSHPRVLQLVIDSLRYWVTEMHVDGFRFDLATTLGRESDAFSNRSAFFQTILQDPVLQNVKMIAEPWDIGWGGYQLGHFPAPWVELNGKYRDGMRGFWKGDHGKIREFASRITGSKELFHDRGPLTSINFLTSHDGFTLMDLVSYNEKHNEANGEDNRDGDSHNHSWNHGVEGPTDDPGILQLRLQQRRNLMATLILSQGVPFICAGDEIGRSQGGNNNAYCQDNEISWLDWNLTPVQEDFREYVAKLLELRKSFQTFRKSRYVEGRSPDTDEFRDMRWFTYGGQDMQQSDWEDATTQSLTIFITGFSPDNLEEWRKSEAKEAFLLLINASDKDLDFILPGNKGVNWSVLIDTVTGFLKKPKPALSQSKINVSARSMQVLQLKKGSELEAQTPVAPEKNP